MSNKTIATAATMGIDIGKNSFHVVGLDRRGARLSLDGRTASVSGPAGRPGWIPGHKLTHATQQTRDAPDIYPLQSE